MELQEGEALHLVLRTNSRRHRFKTRTRDGDRPRIGLACHTMLRLLGMLVTNWIAPCTGTWRLRKSQDQASRVGGHDCSEAPTPPRHPRRCRSWSGIIQSRHSRRAVPMNRSQYALA